MKKYAALLTFVLTIGTAIAGPADRRALFGETHIHTRWSFDAYIFLVRATPDDAYEFAKGGPLKHPLGQTYQLSRPLDFMAVTDHGTFLGIMDRMGDPNHPLSKHDLASEVTSPDSNVAVRAFAKILVGMRMGRPIEGLEYPEVGSETWTKIIDSANRHYDPGTFTTLIAYEWTSTPEGQNLHRNVIFRGDTAPAPFTRDDSMKPEDLWAWLDRIRADGHEAMAIPHNSNLSDGRMFELQDSWGKPFTREYADSRNRNEPLAEITQVKGTSETHPMLSPNDEFADFELVEQRVASKQAITKFAGSYIRDAYRAGLEFQDNNGFNPYRFGLIGASDSHTGIVPIEENSYSGKVGARDGSPQARLLVPSGSMDFRFFSASGLAGIWAEENDRENVYDALRRKETWGTSGPRIQVRFFGGFNMDGVDPSESGWVEKAYNSGTSMGGALSSVKDGRVPTFAFWAIKDTESANLDRVQIIKGWSENGESQEHVYDVAWSGDRTIDSDTGKLPAVGNTVNLETLEYTNDIGAVELSGTWTDPDFNANQHAFYYARVIEIPTPRWNLFDAKELEIENPPDLKTTIQERAYTSPIWYDAK